VLDRLVKLRKSSSSHVRGASGSVAAMKLPGAVICTTENTYANAHATSVNVAPMAHSSSCVTSESASM